jgi:dihydroorotase-like cyclic amidohydrolase
VCENPVKIFGIQNKGFIKEGFDADFTIVDMNKTIEIKNENIESKCGWTPFNGDTSLREPQLTQLLLEILRCKMVKF